MLHFLGIAVLVIIGVAIFARGDGTAIVRLGNVIYWAATGIAGLIVAFSLYVVIAGRPEPIMIGLFVTAAALAWLAGRACLYVLAGR
jgi:hypothetical protein